METLILILRPWNRLSIQLLLQFCWYDVIINYQIITFIYFEGNLFYWRYTLNMNNWCLLLSMFVWPQSFKRSWVILWSCTVQTGWGNIGVEGTRYKIEARCGPWGNKMKVRYSVSPKVLQYAIPEICNQVIKDSKFFIEFLRWTKTIDERRKWPIMRLASELSIDNKILQFTFYKYLNNK